VDDFSYKHGSLHCESVDVRVIARKFGTPLYVYSQQTIESHYNRIESAFSPLDPGICFSVKSCSNLSILAVLKQAGACFDVVSGGELARVLEIGVEPSRVVFAGVGKTDREINAALDAGIGWFNVESEQELDTLATLAARRNTVAQVALRVNPDVDPQTHRHTTTGKSETKFGVDLQRAAKVFEAFAKTPAINLAGVHVHIGSPVNRIEPFVESIKRTLDLTVQLRKSGHKITAINIGGGYGAHYSGEEAPTAADYAAHIVPLLQDAKLSVMLEPGRSIMANAGVLIAETIFIKSSGDKKFVIVDAAMTDLIRPALYDAFHFAWPVAPENGMTPPRRSKDLQLEGTELVDVVGPVCETGDFLARDRWLPSMSRGDLIAIFSAGAYGFSMSSQYNSRPRAAEVLVHGDECKLIRRRETYEDLVALERHE